MSDVPIKVCGIPALARVTHFYPGTPANHGTYCRRTANLVDPGHPAEPPEVDFEVLDRKGYPARWLEAKAEAADEDLEAEVLRSLSNER